MPIGLGGPQHQKSKRVVDVDPTIESRLSALEERVKQFVTFRQILYVTLALLALLLASILGPVVSLILDRIL